MTQPSETKTKLVFIQILTALPTECDSVPPVLGTTDNDPIGNKALSALFNDSQIQISQLTRSVEINAEVMIPKSTAGERACLIKA